MAYVAAAGTPAADGRRPTAGARLLHAPPAVMNGLVAGRTLPGENRPTADNDEIRSIPEGGRAVRPTAGTGANGVCG